MKGPPNGENMKKSPYGGLFCGLQIDVNVLAQNKCIKTKNSNEERTSACANLQRTPPKTIPVLQAERGGGAADRTWLPRGAPNRENNNLKR